MKETGKNGKFGCIVKTKESFNVNNLFEDCSAALNNNKDRTVCIAAISYSALISTVMTNVKLLGE